MTNNVYAVGVWLNGEALEWKATVEEWKAFTAEIVSTASTSTAYYMTKPKVTEVSIEGITYTTTSNIPQYQPSKVINNVADLLEEAATLIGNLGWTKGIYRNIENEHCTLGAIETVCWNSKHGELFSTAIEYFAKFLKDRTVMAETVTAGSSHTVTAWNDCEVIDKLEVIEMLRLAAKEWRNDHERG